MIHDVVIQLESLGYCCQSIIPLGVALFYIQATSSQGGRINFLYDEAKEQLIDEDDRCVVQSRFKFLKKLSSKGWRYFLKPWLIALFFINKIFRRCFSISHLLFLKEFLFHPRRVGSIWPSSKALCRKIAILVKSNDKNSRGLIVELGAGTGVVTQALLKQGIPAQRLLIIEKQSTLVKLLRKRFPSIQVLEGDAADLGKLVRSVSALPVEAVVSSLPLASIDRKVRDKILSGICSLLHPRGCYIQYQYFRRDIVKKFYYDLFKSDSSKRVFLNFPPATVRSYSIA